MEITAKQAEQLEQLESDITEISTTMVATALYLASTFIDGHAMAAGAYPTGCQDCEGSATYAEHMAEWLREQAENLIK